MDGQIRFYVESIAQSAIQVPDAPSQPQEQVFPIQRPAIEYFTQDQMDQLLQQLKDNELRQFSAQLDAVKGKVVSLPRPNDPFSIKVNNCEILASPTLSVGEILSDERDNLPRAKFTSDDQLYDEAIKTACKTLDFDVSGTFEVGTYDILATQQYQSGRKLVQLQSTKIMQGIEKIVEFYQANLIPQLNDIQIEQQISVLVDNSLQLYTSVKQASQFSSLALFQKIQSANVIDAVTEWQQQTADFSELQFVRLDGQLLKLDHRYFEPYYLKLLLQIFTNNLEMIDEYFYISQVAKKPAYTEYECLLTDDFVAERRSFDLYYERLIQQAKEQNFLLSQLVLVSLAYYCVRNQYVEAVSRQQLDFLFSLNHSDYNPHCSDFFSQTNLNYALKVYQQVFLQDYAKVPAVTAFRPLLPDGCLILISDMGTLFAWSTSRHVYEPIQEVICGQATAIKSRKQQTKIEMNIAGADAQIVLPSNDQKIQVQEFLFDDFSRDRGCYDQAIRNLQKMATAAKQRIIKRYRSNKNANSINAECIRCRKFFNDIESIRRRFLNENRPSTSKKVFSGVKREKKNKEEVKKTTQQQQELIKNKLDETEKYIEQLIRQKPASDEAQIQQKTILDQLAKDEEVHGDNGLNIEILQTPRAFNGVLKHYQKIGFSWLYHMFSNGLSCLLCDQMGLGKTVQIIAYFQQICQAQQRYGPFLVICPNSLLNNWVQEMRRFAPDLKVWPYWGSVQQRQAIRSAWGYLCFVNQVVNKYGEQSFQFNENERFGSRKCPMHVLITSYSLAVSDIKQLNKIPWVSVVLDEGQMIKSSETKRWRTLMGIACDQKIILSGTPIQNTLTELWSLLHFALPEVFRSKENFTQWFTRDIEMAATQKIGTIRLNQEQLLRLQSILSPFVLRREKKDVAQQLGEKKENNILCNLSRRQKELYEGLKCNLNFAELFNQASDDELKNIVMQLRKIVNHPQIFDRSQVKSPLILLQEVQQRVFTYNSSADDEKTEIDTDAPTDKQDVSVAESETTAPVVPVLKQAKIKFETQQLDDFANLIQIQYQSDRARESYLEASIRCDQNRLFEIDIPGLVFNAFVDLTNDRGFQIEGCAAQMFNAGSAFEEAFSLMGLDFSHIQTLASVVRCLLGNRSYLYDHFVNKRLLAKFNQSAILQYILNAMLLLQQKTDLFFDRQQIEPIVEFTHPLQIKTYAPSCVAFYPLLYTSSVNYWEHHFCTLSSFGDLQSRELRRFAPAVETSLTPLLYYSINELIEQSGKLNALDKLLRKLFAERQVCLIYCQMTKMMDLLEEYLMFRRYKFVRLDGSYSVADRRSAVDQFMTDDSIFVFLLSTRAGSLGLNLTRASNVIFYEQDWNPTQDLQAQDRVHRLGQTKEVQIWKIIARGSIDEKIFERAEQKIVVQRLVLSGQDRDENGNLISEANKKITQKELLMGILKE